MPVPENRPLGLLVWVAAFAGSLFASEHARAAAPLPNVVWITAEDHGPHLGCYGDPVARTPNLDRLASRGLRYERCWSVCPVCAPARTALITGMYPSSLGAEHMRSMVPMPLGTKLYPQLLREAGYHCTNNSKEDYNVSVAGKIWDESSGKAHWRSRKSGQPFFAVFNFTGTHESRMHRLSGKPPITDPAQVRVPAYHPDLPDVRTDWAHYHDGIRESDVEAGRILAELDADGLTDETIVFYYADHGPGLARSKRSACDSGLRVPLIVHFPAKFRHLAPPDYAEGAVSKRLVSFVDFAPTLLSVCGVAVPEWQQGAPFAGTRPSEPHKFVFGSRGRMDERHDLVRCVTDGRHVYVRNLLPRFPHGQHVDYQFKGPLTRAWNGAFVRGETNPAQSFFWQAPRPVEELYDLASDPDENPQSGGIGRGGAYAAEVSRRARRNGPNGTGTSPFGRSRICLAARRRTARATVWSTRRRTTSVIELLGQLIRRLATAGRQRPRERLRPRMAPGFGGGRAVLGFDAAAPIRIGGDPNIPSRNSGATGRPISGGADCGGRAVAGPRKRC